MPGPPVLSQFLMMAGSRLLVCRSRRLALALAPGDEKEKTLLRSPWAADDMVPPTRYPHFSTEF